MNLASATMIRAAQNWCRVSVNDIEGHQFRLLRAELGLEPNTYRIPRHPAKENHQPRSSMKPYEALQGTQDQIRSEGRTKFSH